MLPRPETQDPVFSIRIVNVSWASSAQSSRLRRRKAIKTLLNISFRHWQFATLRRPPDETTCRHRQILEGRLADSRHKGDDSEHSASARFASSASPGERFELKAR